MKKLRSAVLALTAAAALTFAVAGPAMAAAPAPEVAAPAAASESVAPLAAPTPCDGAANVRFSQYGPGLTTSKIQNCRTVTIRVQFIGNNAAGPSVDYSSCRTLAPGASTTIQDGLLLYWKQWRYC